MIEVSAAGREEKIEALKIIKAKVASDAPILTDKDRPCIIVKKPKIYVYCGLEASKGALEILEVQPVTKNAMKTEAFVNGLNNRTLNLA